MKLVLFLFGPVCDRIDSFVANVLFSARRFHYAFCMKRLLLFLFCTCVCFSAAADDFLETILLPGNECIGSVAVLRSGDIVAAGVDFTANDILLFQLSSDGAVRKAQRISGSGADEAQTIAGTSDGGGVVVGSTSSFGEGNSDGFIMKLRKTGKVAWKRTFGTSGNEHFVKIVQTADKGFIVLGDADHDPNLNDIVVAKFNSRGKPVWRKVVSGGDFDHASGLGLTSDNGAIVAIASDFVDGVRSILPKFSANGDIEWSRVYGSSDDHLALSVIQTSDGGYYFTEIYTPTGSQKSRTVLSKLDPSGVPIWARSYKSRGANFSASVTAVEVDQTILLAGNTITSSGGNSQGVLISLDEDGKILWRKKIKPDSRPVFIGQPLVDTTDGSILVSGCAGDRTTNDLDSVVLKLQGDGTIQGGCSKLKNLSVSSASFNLTSSAISLVEISVPFFTASAGFHVEPFAAAESLVCSGD